MSLVYVCIYLLQTENCCKVIYDQTYSFIAGVVFPNTIQGNIVV